MKSYCKYLIASVMIFGGVFRLCGESVNGELLLKEALKASPDGTFQAEGFYIDHLEHNAMFHALPPKIREELDPYGFFKETRPLEKNTVKIDQLTTAEGGTYRRVEALVNGKWPCLSIQNAEGCFYQNHRNETFQCNWTYPLGTWNELHLSPVRQELEDATYEVKELTKYDLLCYQVTMVTPDNYARRYNEHPDWDKYSEKSKNFAEWNDKPSPLLFPKKRVFVIVDSTKQIVSRKHYNRDGNLTLHYEFTTYTPNSPDLSKFEVPGTIIARGDNPLALETMYFWEQQEQKDAVQAAQKRKDKISAWFGRLFRNAASGGWIAMMCVSVFLIAVSIVVIKIRKKE